ncbi:oleate hydratase [Chitinophaga dinghuensis]|uniref:Oleate hydratase n=1 Tax=Chitinophaga dinghuensis TaxID=1539050 RepID=A0A327VSM1_9BACT|nr:oleate hydratase [Chitinophaga dinghuensis]RAJ79037.1 oleate hydratase [Chitinophaga dinghuensis]
MYYSNGNYEAFARPVKPENVELKSAYLIGAGLASMAAAVFLIRDGQMKGDKITIFEELKLPGGSLDGIFQPQEGFIIRGGREMENHFECLWDLFRSIPSLEIKDASVLDEFYWLNKKDPNYSLMRATMKQGQSARTDGKFTLSDKATEEIIQLFLTAEDQLNDKRINEVFTQEFFDSNFWLYWRTMFAFEEWHSAMEMRRYIMRFIHHIGGLPDLSALKFTKYNQYESLVLPLISFLKSNGVNIIYDAQVKNVEVQTSNNRKIARKIIYEEGGTKKEIALTENDLVFVTNGSITECSTYGDQHNAAILDDSPGGSWNLWMNLAKQDKAFGNPMKFCGNIQQTNFVSATVTTLDDKIPPYIEKICQRDPFAGKVVTGGIVSVKDSSWLLSWTFNRQPHFKSQGKNQLVGWIYGLFSDKPGDFIKKTMKECNGIEIAAEWLYHMGVPPADINELATNSANTIPCMMPYVMSYFMPRALGDRPQVVPEGAVNLAFIGNFAETERDTVFTTEYSVRTAMEAVYQLLNVDRGVPEVFASAFDIRTLLSSSARLMDGKKILDIKVPLLVKYIEKKTIDKSKGTMVYEMLKDAGLI